MLQKTEQTSIAVDLIRALAIVLVITVHAAIEPHPIVQEMNLAEAYRWFTVNTFNSLAMPSVPLFVMLSGALLLQPTKVEPIRVFLRKRIVRLGWPFIFWGTVYFAWRWFANQEVLSASSVIQGLLTGPYYHFWFLYMLFGLYLLTPVLRVVTANAERKTIKYFLALWFFGVAIIPLLVLLSGFAIEGKLFAITGWVGYFLLGYYLLATRIRSSTLCAVLLGGFLLTILGTYAVTALIGGYTSLFFLDNMSVSVILASSSLFMLLLKLSPSNIETRFPRVNKLVQAMGQNTLSIYLLHVIILESFQRGYFGFPISVNTITPIVEIPLITTLTLFVSLGIVLLLKRIPFLKRVTG